VIRPKIINRRLSLKEEKKKDERPLRFLEKMSSPDDRTERPRPETAVSNAFGFRKRGSAERNEHKFNEELNNFLRNSWTNSITPRGEVGQGALQPEKGRARGN